MGSMKDQLTGIYEPRAYARSADPSTSHEAAAKVTPKLNKIQREVLELFRINRDMTDLELQCSMQSHGSTHRTRRAELVKKGLIRDSGRRVKFDGSNRIIWEIVP